MSSQSPKNKASRPAAYTGCTGLAHWIRRLFGQNYSALEQWEGYRIVEDCTSAEADELTDGEVVIAWVRVRALHPLDALLNASAAFDQWQEAPLQP